MPDDNTTERPTRPTRCSSNHLPDTFPHAGELIRQTPALPRSLCSLCGVCFYRIVPKPRHPRGDRQALYGQYPRQGTGQVMYPRGCSAGATQPAKWNR